MKALILSASVFSPSQIAVCTVIAVVLFALIAVNIAVAVIFSKRGEHRLCSRDLQLQREQLLQRLNYVKGGGEVERGTYPLWEIAAKLSDGGQIVPPEVAVAAVASVDEDEDDEDGAQPKVDILAVADMSANTRDTLGFMGEEYDLKRYYVRYSYGFNAKLRSADEDTKELYRNFITHVLSYKGVKINESYRKLRIYSGRNTLAVMLFRGKKLCAAFALNPEQFAQTKYRGEDMSAVKRFEKTPMLMRFTSERKEEYSEFLFDVVAETSRILKGEEKESEFDLEEQSRDDMFAANAMRIIVLGEAPPLPPPPAEDETAEFTAEADEEEYFDTADDVTVAINSELYEQENESDEHELEEMVTESGSLVRYNRSYTARLAQASADLKGRYGELKNYLLSYSGITSRISWRKESFGRKRKCVASLFVRGKTLCLSLLLNPQRYEGTKYKVDATRGKNAKLPLTYKIRSDRAAKFAKELIDELMKELGVKKQPKYVPSSYIPVYYSTEVLIRRDLIRVVGEPIDIKREDEQALKDGIRYDRSFAARIIQSDELLKMRYSELKNCLLGYEGVTCRSTWRRETFKAGKNSVAYLSVRGRTLCLYLAADPSEYADTKYRGEVATNKEGAKYPLLYRIKSERKLNYAKQMIDSIMRNFGAQPAEREYENFSVPYRSTATLVKHGLIRVSYRASFGITRENGDSVNEQRAAKRESEGGEELSLNISDEQITEVAAAVNEVAAAVNAVEVPESYTSPVYVSPPAEQPAEQPEQAEEAEQTEQGEQSEQPEQAEQVEAHAEQADA